jgi:hypothetical protein
MKTACAWIFTAALALAATQALAAAAATVEGVQMPAWVERGGQRMALAPGMELRAGDQLNTGAGSRLVVKLAEGSLVKLGENGSLHFAELDPAREMFRAALSVLEGAFRFTTDVLAKGRRREVSVRMATVTAGIRGTDLWGRSRAKNEIVCLIEGQAEIGAEGEPAVTLDQPLQFYQRQEGTTQPVGFIAKQQLDQWASEVELEAGKGAARRGGRWSVRLARADNQNDALRVYDELRSAGYPAEIFPTMDGDKRAYVVRIRSLPSQAEAQALAERLRGRFGIDNPSVSG